MLHLWFTDYLTNRKQFVKVGDAESNKLQMLCGVPQGSTPGLLLFLLHINDISIVLISFLFEYLLIIQVYSILVKILMILKR